MTEQINLVVKLQESLSHKVENSGDYKLETREQITSLCTYAHQPPLAEIEDTDSRR